MEAKKHARTLGGTKRTQKGQQSVDPAKLQSQLDRALDKVEESQDLLKIKTSMLQQYMDKNEVPILGI